MTPFFIACDLIRVIQRCPSETRLAYERLRLRKASIDLFGGA